MATTVGDSWQITPSNLVGRVALVIPDGGYALQMLPFLLLGRFAVPGQVARSRPDT